MFVSGVKGNSLGSDGHTGIFLSNSQIIHCTYGYGSNNMAVTPAYQWMGDYSGLPVHCYQIISASGGAVENRPQQNILVLDGSFGPATAKRLQEYLGCAVRDGVISHQWRSVHNENIYAAQFDSTQIGSDVVSALQKKIGVTADRLFGPNTVRAFQRYLGTTQDGVISPRSDAVRELQRRLNNNTF